MHRGAPFLREVGIRALKPEALAHFPFTVPAIKSLGRLTFPTAVTFFVGENGSGKSTLLEGIAASANLPTVGAEDIRKDETLGSQAFLGKVLRLTWDRRTMRGFFLRAEDFFGFAKRQSALRAELLRRLDEIEVDFAESSAYARGLAMGPVKSSLADMERRYGKNLDENSHGQSFLKLFQSRFVPLGLYLLDEPEAPLSPQSQLALMVMMQDMIAQGGQFVIATHSPILLAYPGATIYSFDHVPVERVEYDALEHVNLTRDFLNAPGRFLRALRSEEAE